MVAGFVEGAQVKISATENVTGVLAKVNAAVGATLRNVLGIGPAISRAFDSIRGRIRGIGESISSIGQSLIQSGSRMAAFGALSVAGFGSAFKASSSYQEQMNRFRALFGDQTAAAEQWGETLAKAVRRSKFQVVSAMNDFMGFGQGLGLAKEQSAALSKELTSLAIDFGSFNNLPTDLAILKVLSGASGETEAVKRYGIDVSATALALRGVGLEASQAEKAMMRLQIIRESMGRQNAIGDAARTAFSGANSLEAFKSKLIDLKIAFGSVTEGPFTAFLNKMNLSIDGIIQWMSANKRVVPTIVALGAATLVSGVAFVSLGIVLSSVGKAISAFSTLLSVALLPLSLVTKSVGLTIRSMMLFGKVGIGSMVIGVKTLLPVMDALQGAMRLSFSVIGRSAGALPGFARAVASAAGGSVRLISAMSSAFVTSFRAVSVATYSSIMAFFGLARVVQQVPAIASTSLTVLASSAKNTGMILSNGIAGSARVASGAMTVLSTTIQITARTMGFLQSLVLQLPQTLRTIGAAATLVGVQLIKGMVASLTVLRSGLASTALGFLGMAKTAVVSMISVSAAIIKTIATAISPIIAKVALIAAVAAAIGGAIYLFRDQIAAAFSGIGTFISDFIEGSKTRFASFLEGAKAVFFDVVDFAKTQFWSLLDIGKQTFGGINDAFNAGDFKLAFQIAFAGAKVAFLDFAFNATSRWEDSIVGFVSGLIKLKFWFKTIFEEITGFVKLAFEKMENARQGAVNSISRGIVAGLVKIGAVDAEVAQTLEEDIARQQKSKEDAIRAETAREVAAIEKEKEAALNGVDAGIGKFKEGLGNALDSAKNDLVGLNGQAADAAKKAAEEFNKVPADLANGLKDSIGEIDVTANVTASLKGMDVRSSEGWQKMIDAMNGARTEAVASVAKAAAADFALPGVNVADIRGPIEGGMKMANGAAGQAGSGLAGLMAAMERNNALLEQINTRLVNDVPTAMGTAVGKAIADNEAVVGLPNQAS